MSEDEAALLRMIRGNPDDDLPRLVYADWLEERDHAEQAEMIREQCADPTPRVGTWIAPISVTYERGFIVEARCLLVEWEMCGPEICATHPVQRVTITDKEPWGFYGEWYWFITDDENYSHLRDVVPLGFVDIADVNMSRPFPDVTAAKAVLSDGCIGWAKSQALTHA